MQKRPIKMDGQRMYSKQWLTNSGMPTTCFSAIGISSLLSVLQQYNNTIRRIIALNALYTIYVVNVAKMMSINVTEFYPKDGFITFNELFEPRFSSMSRRHALMETHFKDNEFHLLAMKVSKLCTLDGSSQIRSQSLWGTVNSSCGGEHPRRWITYSSRYVDTCVLLNVLQLSLIILH